MTNYVAIVTVLFSVMLQGSVAAQSQIFVPLQFEYPDSILATSKTYVYKNVASGALRYKDIVLKKKENDLIINWKQYDESHLADSSTEVNGRSYDHYMIVSHQSFKAIITEDSIHQNGTRFGEKVQTLFFNLNSTISLFETVHSMFLKDTAVTWHGRNIPCLVIQSFYRQKLANSLFSDKSKEITGVVYHYFGKDVGLIMYRSELDNEKQTWQLIDIRETKVK
jgi:hypothetical protein